MASAWYRTGLKHFLDGDIDFDADTIQVALMQSGYTFDATDEFVSDLSNECSDTGYVRKDLGNKLTGIATVNVYADNTADITWTTLGASQTVNAAVFFRDDVGGDASSQLICYCGFGAKTLDGTDFTIQINTNGICRFVNQE